MDKLQEARKTISQIDLEMADLFVRRMEAVGQVAEYKKERGLPIFDGARERELLEKGSQRVSDPTLREYYVGFLQSNMDLSKDYQRRLLEGMKVAYSGSEGAFAHIAAGKIFPGSARISCRDFKSAYESVVLGENDVAVLPIENSYEGDVARVMDLTYFGSLFINGVYDMAVEQNLFSTKDADRRTIKKVISHPQALGQCADYVEENGYETEEAVNTASAAKKVAELNDKAVGVICSLEAGNEYGLKLIDRKINKDSTNTTRFAVFSRIPRDNSSDQNNFIVLFTVRDEAGSLGKAISVFGECGYNLKALKSRPSKDVIWNYYFFVEGEGQRDRG